MAGALDLSFILDDLGSVHDEEFDDVIKFVPYMIDFSGDLLAWNTPGRGHVLY